MKEIIYIQAGTFSNYTGTHFWNTQDHYLSGTNEDPFTNSYDPGVSYREGLSQTGQPTLCPRLLVFDKKANFGTLAKANALLGTNEDELPTEHSTAAIWNGEILEYRQDPIQRNTHYSSLDKSDDYETVGDTEYAPDVIENIGYWSDFNRVHYASRTVQKIPDPAEWEDPDGDWKMGQELFTRYNEDTDLMEGSLRLFLEECDSAQGVQVMNDTSSYGGFVISLLTSLRDEIVKLPCLTLPLLSDTGSQQIDVDDHHGMRKIINDAIYLRSLNELSSMSIPIQSPANWPHNDIYHDSAILSAHIESSTLPLRLGAYENVGSMSAQLNWRGTTPFGELSGIFPLTPTEEFNTQLVNFSAGRLEQNGLKSTQFARRDITRGFSPLQITTYDTWSTRLSTQDSFVSRLHTTAYPIPTPYPLAFKDSEPRQSRHHGALKHSLTAPLFSSISTTSGTALLFDKYATSIETCLKRKLAVESIGIDNDELKELANDLWALHDNFDDGSNPARPNDDDSFGEDE